MKNITNTGNKGIPDHICFCAMTISLELRGPTHISTAHNKNKTNRDFIRDHLSCRS
ncbi:hypothetical protein MtrunA17_Chr6g0457331 [Medicago truncatula]|uniref:Uncharacterized protein n=2 Tax=50 kb inversion clade TaxID=2231393 RepID=A0A6A4NAC8_LUPAL|nr:hypothetical protein Lalb_Chr00c24g0407031 [Lupinus albus]RHN50432.1 hypothetical protein MtrunA17_Chr6g0457331 [Medicago truncatula]